MYIMWSVRKEEEEEEGVKESSVCVDGRRGVVLCVKAHGRSWWQTAAAVGSIGGCNTSWSVTR